MELNNVVLYRKVRDGYCISFRLCMQLMMLVTAAIVCTAQAKTPILALTPAPAPAPSFENVTQSLVYGGEYSTFTGLLVETKEDVVFQGMANDTEGAGITIFAPTDKAFSSKLVSSLLRNLTASQKVLLVEYHALNVYQAFKNLQNSNQNQTSTLATNSNGGGRYKVNITFTGGGRLQISSGWTTATLSTTIYSTKPVSIFAIDEVLLPDEIFGLPPPPPPPSPVPSPRVPSPPPPSSSSSRPSIAKDSSFSSPLFTPCLSSLILSLLLFKLLITSGN